MTTNNPNLLPLRRVEQILAEETVTSRGVAVTDLDAVIARVGAEPELMQALAQAGLEAEVEDMAREMGAVQAADGTWSLLPPTDAA